MKGPFDTAITREKAVAWKVCPASILKVLKGGVVRGLAGHRIRSGLQADGLAHLAPRMFREQLGRVADEPGIALDRKDAEDEHQSSAVAV